MNIVLSFIFSCKLIIHVTSIYLYIYHWMLWLLKGTLWKYHENVFIKVSNIYQHWCTCYIDLFVFLFVCLGFFVPLEKFFTHMEISPWPVKGCKSWHMLGTHGHWAVRVLWRATFTVPQGIRLKLSWPRIRDTHTYCRAFDSGAVTTCTCFHDLGLSRLGFDHPFFRLRGESSYPLRPCSPKKKSAVEHGS